MYSLVLHISLFRVTEILTEMKPVTIVRSHITVTLMYDIVWLCIWYNYKLVGLRNSHFRLTNVVNVIMHIKF